MFLGTKNSVTYFAIFLLCEALMLQSCKHFYGDLLLILVNILLLLLLLLLFRGNVIKWHLKRHYRGEWSVAVSTPQQH